ncbi:MAG: hypothetical protein WC804_09520 [Sphingomonas sp.]|uniref:hypothetical protein n=1 Tax=Sphingomonas sp. TaxID=28214 RepID=UPI0035690679
MARSAVGGVRAALLGRCCRNVGVAHFLHDVQTGEWAISAMIGVLVGAVWNYALSSRFVWGRY